MSQGGTTRSGLATALEVFFADGCGCQSCLVVVALTLMGLSWVASHRARLERAMLVAIGVGAVGVLVREGLRRRRRRHQRPGRVDPSAAPVPLAAVGPGWVHTAGLVGASARPMDAPLGAPRCMFYRVVIETAEAPHAILFEGRSSEELVIEDGADAKIVVKLGDATWRMTRSHEYQHSPHVPSEPVSSYLALRGLVMDRPVRARVEWIAPHELVFVRGLVTEVGEDATGYRTSERAALVMTQATLALEEKPQEP